MIENGAQLTLDIEKPAAGGRMLARHAGQVVLVSGTIPGERVIARVERVGKGVVFAEALEIATPSSDRRAGAADWRCGGSVFSYIAYPRQLGIKAQIIQDAFTRIGRLPLANPPDVLGSPETGYRMRARLHVRGDRIGFFREGTHDLCDAGATGQLLPQTIEWLGHIQTELVHGSSPGKVTGLELAENIPGDQRAVHVESRTGGDAWPFESMAKGDGQVTDTICVGETATLTLTRDVRSFFQGNRYLLEPLARRVVGLARAEHVVDLYAGVGLFGLSLAAAGTADVTLVEGDPLSSADLVRNAVPFGHQVSVRRQSVETFLSSKSGLPHGAGSTFVVDPPRTGMTREALTGIVRHAPSRIVYVSCDVATLARDARTLVDAGWELTEVTGIDLFPNTAHVESIALFDRS
jgi:23S rRNA (uracil1939-C5)-methyltransferase